jgi:hypothetical protein
MPGHGIPSQVRPLSTHRLRKVKPRMDEVFRLVTPPNEWARQTDSDVSQLSGIASHACGSCRGDLPLQYEGFGAVTASARPSRRQAARRIGKSARRSSPGVYRPPAT